MPTPLSLALIDQSVLVAGLLGTMLICLVLTVVAVIRHHRDDPHNRFK